MPFGTRSLPFSNSLMKPLPRHGSTFMIISLHAPSRHGGVVHQLEEVGMLTAKIDLLMKKLEDPTSIMSKLSMPDSRVKSAEKQDTCVLIARRSIRTLTLLVTPTLLIKALVLGGISLVFHSTTAKRVVVGKTSIEVNHFSRKLFGIS
jgi:hypothetical protein